MKREHIVYFPSIVAAFLGFLTRKTGKDDGDAEARLRARSVREGQRVKSLTGQRVVHAAPNHVTTNSPSSSGRTVMFGAVAKVSRPARIIILIPVLSLLLSGCGFNDIPTYEEQAKAKWSEVLNQYQRRSDLIPNLVETVKGFAKQESTVLEAVTAARAQATAIQVNASTITDPEAFKRFQEAQAQLSTSLGRLLAISESYPDLKSNQNFLALQSQLEGTENRIAVARRDYIEAVRIYNTELRTFPGRIWAAIFYRSNKPMEEFTVDDSVRRPPQVKF